MFGSSKAEQSQEIKVFGASELGSGSRLSCDPDGSGVLKRHEPFPN